MTDLQPTPGIIYKDIPIPAAKWPGSNATLYRLGDMSVGDSIIIDERHRSSVLSWASQRKMKMVSRKVSPGAVRVWRTA